MRQTNGIKGSADRRGSDNRSAKDQNLFAAATYFGALLLGVLLPSTTETAIANGDTRTLSLYHSHTGESIDATYRVNGVYDPAVLEKLNWFLRDWRNNDEIKMDPRLFDVVWEVYRSAGANQPIVVYSAYRSPKTNAMLRQRSRAVAEHSQHILGRAMDTTMPGMSMERIREIGMRLQRGGVGYYANANFVHLDVGGVRYWPRMSYEQLARVFPDGKSVLLASNGRALPGYEEARAEIASRGGVMADVPPPSGFNLFAWLFGNHDRDQEEDAEDIRGGGAARRAGAQVAAQPQSNSVEDASRAGAATKTAVSADRSDKGRAPARQSGEAVASAPEAEPNRAADEARTVVASLAPPPRPRDGIEESDLATGSIAKEGASKEGASKEKADKRSAFTPPLPPLRPLELIADADAPIPPARPESLGRAAALASHDRDDAKIRSAAAKSDSAAGPKTVAENVAAESVAATRVAVGGNTPLARAARLPVVITQGPKDQADAPVHVLAYAESAQQSPTLHAKPAEDEPAEVERTTSASARLDHSNLPGFTGDVAGASAPTPSVLGQALTGLRQAARIIPDALSGLPTAGFVSAFKAVASELDSAHFTGPAIKPVDSSVSVAEVSSPPRN